MVGHMVWATVALEGPRAVPHGIIPSGSSLPELGAAPGPGFPDGACIRARGWLGSSTPWLPDRKSASLWAPIPQAPRSAAGRVLGREEGSLISLQLQALPCSGTLQGSPLLTRAKCPCGENPPTPASPVAPLDRAPGSRTAPDRPHASLFCTSGHLLHHLGWYPQPPKGQGNASSFRKSAVTAHPLMGTAISGPSAHLWGLGSEGL